MDPSVRKYATGMLGDSLPKDGILNYKHACQLMYEFNSALERCAKNYKTYKMEDHTINPSREPNKKRLNKDDIQKINLMQKVLGQKPLPKDLYKSEVQETMSRKDQRII